MPDLTSLPAIAYEFRFVALIAVCIVALARLFYIAAERDLRGVYERLGIPWDDREAAELEVDIRGDLGMPEPVVDLVPLLPSPEATDEEFEAWVRQALFVAREAERLAAEEATWIDAEWEHFNEREGA